MYCFNATLLVKNVCSEVVVESVVVVYDAHCPGIQESEGAIQAVYFQGFDGRPRSTAVLHRHYTVCGNNDVISKQTMTSFLNHVI